VAHLVFWDNLTAIPFVAPWEDNMDNTTLIIIVIIVVLLLGGGGWYGRGRWF
jgi:hypothetical protein